MMLCFGRTAALTTDEVNGAPTEAPQQNEAEEIWRIVGILFITITISIIVIIAIILIV